MHLSSTKEIIVYNIIWSVLGKIVTLLGSLFIGIIVARYLGPKQYGIMNYVISYVTLFQIIAYFGLDSIEVREEAKENIPANTIIGTAFGLKCILAVITVAITFLTAIIFQSDTKIIIYITIYSVSVIANTLSVIRNRFTSLLQNEYVVKSEISRTLIGMALKAAMLLCHLPLIWFIAASAFDFVLLGGGYIYCYHRKIGRMKQWKFDYKYASFLLKESFPLLLTSAAVFIYQRIDQVMIGDMIDKESVGFFATANRFVEILIFVPAMIAHTITPVLVKIREKSNEEYDVKSQQFMNLIFWLTALMSLILSVSSFMIIRYTFGMSYLQAVPILKVLAFKATAFALSTTAGAMLVLEGLQKYAIFRDLFGCAVCIVLNYLMLPKYGAIAAAYIAIVSYICAGYLSDAIIPAYHHLFRKQTITIFYGWLDVIRIKTLLKR